MSKTSDALCQVAQEMVQALDELSFSNPVTHVYNPLNYAWAAHESYIHRFGTNSKRVFYLGMNPGPWGMAQTGVPFGEVSAVREWLRIDAPVGKPNLEHPKRPIQGLACTRSEVSGKRLWGLFAERFGTPKDFFRNQFVSNYCPLVFMDEGGRNITPDKLRAAEAKRLNEICDEHLAQVVRILKPEWLVGIGSFAEDCLMRVAKKGGGESKFRITRILHPSPASPAANKNWGPIVTETLEKAGIWEEKP